LLRGDAQVLADGGDAPVAHAEVCAVSGARCRPRCGRCGSASRIAACVSLLEVLVCGRARSRIPLRGNPHPRPIRVRESSVGTM
jgi:hypothetical protein